MAQKNPFGCDFTCIQAQDSSSGNKALSQEVRGSYWACAACKDLYKDPELAAKKEEMKVDMPGISLSPWEALVNMLVGTASLASNSEAQIANTYAYIYVKIYILLSLLSEPKVDLNSLILGYFLNVLL